MAEALLRKHGGDRYEPLSAALAPTRIHPFAIRVMNEIGIDISGQRSKSVSEYLGKIPVTHVLFVCRPAEEHCPRLYPPAAPQSWPVEDPATFQGTEEECLIKFREVRDDIDGRIQRWLAAQPELLASSAVARSGSNCVHEDKHAIRPTDCGLMGNKAVGAQIVGGKTRREAAVRLILGQGQIIGATATLFFLVKTALSAFTISAAIITALLTGSSIYLFRFKK